ncbi:MAG TPA: gluconokinase [Mucilaginibacter sp.]
MQYVLGVDIGTGSVKAVAVDLQGKAFADNQLFYAFSAPKPGYHEQDPEQLWRAFKDCIRGLVNKIGIPPQAVGLSSAMHSLIPVDEQCDALAPMITWADNRAAEIAGRLRATPKGMAIYKATGTPLHAMSPLCKIIWMRENDLALFNRTYKFVSIKEYIWHKLFGEFKIDWAGASSTGLFDIEKRAWHPAAFEMAGITTASLSDAIATNYKRMYSTGKDLDFLPSGTPFIIGASDGCLANLGSMADRPGIAAVTIGTSGAVRVASNTPLPNEQAMTFSYILDEQTYICGGPINNGGIALQWWLKNMHPNPTTNDYANLFTQAVTVKPGSDGLIFLPYLTGERAPIWDSESCGNFFGIKLQHTQAHFSRAVIEGICFALKDVLDAVQQNSAPIVQINVSGGFTRSELWVQTLSDITGKKLAIVQSEDASAVGAAWMALKGIDANWKYPSSSDAVFYKPIAENAAVYRDSFEVYKKLYRSLKEVMHGEQLPAIDGMSC